MQGVDYLQAYTVPVVSTLGAGDAFVGVAAEWVGHQNLQQAAEQAIIAAASVQRSGAQVLCATRRIQKLGIGLIEKI